MIHYELLQRSVFVSTSTTHSPRFRIDDNGSRKSETGAEQYPVRLISGDDVIAYDADQPVPGLADVHVSGLPVDGERADDPSDGSERPNGRVGPAQ